MNRWNYTYISCYCRYLFVPCTSMTVCSYNICYCVTLKKGSRLWYCECVLILAWNYPLYENCCPQLFTAKVIQTNSNQFYCSKREIKNFFLQMDQAHWPEMLKMSYALCVTYVHTYISIYNILEPQYILYSVSR